MAVYTPQTRFHPEIALTNLSDMTSGAHIMYITSNKDTYITNAASFIKAGLLLEQKVVLVDQKKIWPLIIKRLEENGLEKEKINQIHFIDSEEFYFRSENLQLASIIETISGSIDPDYFFNRDITMRFWGKAQSLFEQDKIIDNLLQYENEVDEYIRDYQNYAVCAYDGTELSASNYIYLKNAHPYVMTDTEFALSNAYTKEIKPPSPVRNGKYEETIANLQLAQTYYSRLVEDMLDAVFITSNNIIMYANKAATKLLETEDLVGKSAYEIMEPDFLEKYLEKEELIWGGEIATPYEMELITSQGKVVEVEILAYPFLFEDLSSTIIIIARDIRVRKENQQLQIKNEKLGIAGQLAASIAHEIRNPLTAIKGFLKLAYQGAMKLKDIYPILDIEINRIETIASELMFLGKPAKSEIKKISIGKILLDVYTLMQSQANLNNVAINLDTYDENLTALCNVDQIKQVFINLVKNAIEAMDNGGIINIEAKVDERWIVVTIKDNGKGIPNEIKNKLGEPFYTTKEKGTGLGLVICYNIIAEHKGKIDFVSEDGVGTTFTIRLPLAN
ncbi:ATP-binding protein [Niallia sp. MER TA 168]|uniref:ATP-binding protein n=1 Tax=Niallia sp. MER TA 168 TaxID=2939568 RepID=UPI00203F5A4C|nr:ATP-binding protein [Niallia sp. MER TA 168]MCM3362797.1 ATP-binding protein [Niallia sp. MER TA 168]